MGDLTVNFTHILQANQITGLDCNLRPYYLQTADDHMLDPKAVMFNMSTHCYTS